MTTDASDNGKTPPPEGSIYDLYREVLPAVSFDAELTKGGDVALAIAPSDIRNVIATSRDDARLSMDLLRNLTAIDWGEDKGMDVVYHLYSIEHRHNVTLKAHVSSEGASVATVSDLYLTADWAERECREMFGIDFEGHPDPRNLLLDEDLDIHPLRKSHPLAEIEIEQGIDVAFFTKEHPPEEPVAEAAPAAEAAAAAAAARPERKPDEDLTPEELAEKKAAQAERVARGRELAAARRIERAAGAPPAGGAGAGSKAAAAPAAAAPAEQAPAAEAPPAKQEAAPAAPPTPPADAGATSWPDDPEERAAAQAERIKRARELAAARREELRKEREGS